MEVEEIQTHSTDLEEEGDLKLTAGPAMTTSGTDHSNGIITNRLLRGWNHHSRIVRVSRATGGKDRHSKVLTSKGLRDRRVRLSVSTAIQFYDIQDRLGFDQPSKAVEWLIKAASEAISELPSLDTFPDTPKQLSEGIEPADPVSMLKSSGCSSTSETSKGSTRASRVKKSRERVRERTAKDKDKDDPTPPPPPPPISRNSFTELLTAGINTNSTTKNNPSSGQPNAVSRHQWGSSGPMEYLPGFLGQAIQAPPTFAMSAEGSSGNSVSFFNHPEQQLVPVTTSEYNLQFTISPSAMSSNSPGLIAGFNRGTLQSNLPHLQRFSTTSSSINNNNLPFFIGAPEPFSSPVDAQFSSGGTDGQLQLRYVGDGTEYKGKAAKSS